MKSVKALIPEPFKALYRRSYWSIVNASRGLGPDAHAEFADPSTRAANPFTTHIPILIGLSRLFEVRRVIEFGCGNYSTKLFLDRNVFPQLTELRSYENNHAWHRDTAAALADDSRARLSYIEGKMASVVGQILRRPCDLIFVDDSGTVVERTRTIVQVMKHRHPASLIVIHDFQTKAYFQAAVASSPHFAFDALNPHTGLLWRTGTIDYERLNRLNRLVATKSASLEPADVQGWHTVFEQEL
jgi:hypothetical protein